MPENTQEHRRKLAELVVASMDMDTLVAWAEQGIQAIYEEDTAYFQEDADNYDLEGVMKKWGCK